MVRFRTLTYVLALLVMLPTAAAAQRDNQYTREANKFLGLAMANQDPAARANLYSQALVHLRQGMERDPQNARVWLMAGTVLAGLGEMAAADSAWDKAVELHPDYAEDVAGEREAAWIEGFNRGMQAMDANNYPEAIRILEGAELVYQGRPEALMNLGALYANAGDNAKAADAFQRAIDATRGPLLAQLTDEQKAEWARFADMATVNMAQLEGALGVDAFQAQNYEQAAQHFIRAAELNPHSRDYVFNHMQSLWAQVGQLEEIVEDSAASAQARADAKAKLLPLYDQVERLVQKTREFDPNNADLFLIEARTQRQRGLTIGTDSAQAIGQQGALRLLTARDVLPAVVDEVTVQPASDGAVIRGRVLPTVTTEGTLRTPPGTPLTIKFTLLGISGQTLGEATVTANAPDKEAETPFELKTDIQGEVAGWKYVVTR